MALSQATATAHVNRWQTELDKPVHNYRRYWPECLFHHAPIENAAAILASGLLRSRNDPENPHPRDVAAREVNAARNHAHDRVRLYFRPRTPTQFNIEGIRKFGECRFGDETHAPVLVMFIFDAARVLTRPDTQFCGMNMQRAGAVPSADEAYFERIPFDKVYHEGPTGGDDSITAHRCAEVLPTSPLVLDDCLRAIFLRSDPERETLLHLLGANRARWAPHCYVSEALKVFEKRYSFVQEVGLQHDGVAFTLNRRFDGRGVSINVRVWEAGGRQVAVFDYSDVPASPPQGQWLCQQAFADGVYKVRMEIEGHLAYEAMMPLGPALF